MYESLQKKDNKLTDERKKSVRQRDNQTGIADCVKSGLEQQTGFSFDDVRVHYNSRKPAQFRALAYTQGTQVYIGPGQEKHLEHELGHVVQQKQGIVRPTGYINGFPVNEDVRLEKEADRCFSNEVIQRKVLPCVQFTREETINRIINLLNLNSQHPDRNHALYHALVPIIGQVEADKLDATEPSEFLNGLTEENLLQAETNLLENTQNRQFDHVYGPLDRMDVSGNFTPNFNNHHFAADFNEAFQISRDRFAAAAPPANNTVLMNFQNDSFYENEYSAITSAAPGAVFNTKASYYFWQFGGAATLAYPNAAAVPAGDPLRGLTRAQVQLMKNTSGKINHFEGVLGTSVAAPAENRVQAFDKMEKAAQKANTIAAGVANDTVSAINDYLQTAVQILGDVKLSDTKVITVFAKAVHHFMNALFSSDYEGYFAGETETGSDYKFPNSSLFKALYNDLNQTAVGNYYTLRGLAGLYNDMLASCEEARDKYSYEEDLSTI